MIINHDVLSLYINDDTVTGKQSPRASEINGKTSKKTAMQTNIVLPAGNTGIKCHKRKKI